MPTASGTLPIMRCWAGARRQGGTRRGRLQLGLQCSSSLTGETPDLATFHGAELQRPGVAVLSVRGVSRGSHKPHNQDVALVQDLHASRGCSPVSLIAVFDGHGEAGHEAAQLVAQQLAAAVEASALADPGTGSAVSWDDSPQGVPSLGSPTALAAAAPTPSACITEDLAQSWLEAAFRSTAEAAAGCSSLMQLSGSTAVVCLVLQDSLVAAWVGDSRAVVGEDMGDGTYQAIQLTHDHKPSTLREAARIRASGGVVARASAGSRGGQAPYRVCLSPTQAAAAGCYGGGLSLSRAFGDLVLAPAGVVPLPDFNVLPRIPSALPSGDASNGGSGRQHLQRPAQVLIVASDGLWEVMGNQEVVDLAASAVNPQAAVQLLLAAALQQWMLRYGGRHRDDISIAVAFL